MQIFLYDNSGHAFTLRLAEQLASHGHDVCYGYMQSFTSPKGNLDKDAGNSAKLRIVPITLPGAGFNKYSYLNRLRDEWRFGGALVDSLSCEQPDVLILCNTPLLLAWRAQSHGLSRKIPVIFWLQDIYSVAMGNILQKKFGRFGSVLGWFFHRIEQRLLKRSDHVVAITDDFKAYLGSAGVAETDTTVIHNWAPLDQLPNLSRENPWAQQQGWRGKQVLMYSGTLGLKHNPQLLLDLAIHYQDRPNVLVVVVSEGVGADWLADAKASQPVENLILLPYQPFESLPQVLASADVFVALLEADAGAFSVPSKILSYLCAQRAIILSAPEENLASRLINESGAGIVTQAGDRGALIQAVDSLLNDAERRFACGQRGRDWAEQHFDMTKIAREFERIVRHTLRDQ